MNGDERKQKMESYASAYSKLVDALRQFPSEMWHYKPSPERWSIHETVVHIADSEANSYIRCRKCIAEPGSTIMGYDESLWSKTLRYQDQSLEEALELFRLLRLRTFKLIQTLPEEVWSNTYEHPENGTVTLEDWLGVYERHIPEHIEQMWAVYREWVDQNW